MVRSMELHEKYITSCIEKQNGDVHDLFLYHQTRMHDFQHEWLIHLLVTMLVITATLVVLGITIATHELILLPVVILLLVLCLAYLIHYRNLENGVQSLYTISEKLGKEIIRK